MRYLNLVKAGMLLLIVAVAFSACEKVNEVVPLGDNGQNIIRIVEYGGTGSDFVNSGLVLDNTLSSESVDVQLVLDGPKVYSNDITITVGIDTSLVAIYSATKPVATDKYEVLPVIAYTPFVSKEVTIKAGQTISSVFQVEFKPDMIDGAKNLMLPIVIKNIVGGGDDLKPASNSGVAYFHFIGNPLAGAYNVDGYFYHPTAPRTFTRTGPEGALLAYSPNSLVTELGDLGASGYYAILSVPDATNITTIQAVTITPYPGSISPVYQWNDGLPSANPGYTAAWPGSSQCNNTYDPATKTFYLRYGYLGGNGFRVTEEIIVKQ